MTSLLISHRFSSVRNADRIVVLEGGRVVETGTHEELIELRGRYAELFRLQAERFLEDDSELDHDDDGAGLEEIGLGDPAGTGAEAIR